MHPVETLLNDTRAHYVRDPDLARVALNARSWVEANLAVELLSGSVPEKALVTLTNVREALKEIPRCPMSMAIDFQGLAQVWELEREGHAWVRAFDDASGSYSIALLGEGNYCYDIVVRAEGKTLMLMPKHSEEDFLNPDVIDFVMERPCILGTVVELLQAMGLPFCPAFYMSLDDWRQEYAQDVFEEVLQDFGLGELDGASRISGADSAATNPNGNEVRVRGVGNDGKITWLI